MRIKSVFLTPGIHEVETPDNAVPGNNPTTVYDDKMVKLDFVIPSASDDTMTWIVSIVKPFESESTELYSKYYVGNVLCNQEIYHIFINRKPIQEVS